MSVNMLPFKVFRRQAWLDTLVVLTGPEVIFVLFQISIPS